MSRIIVSPICFLIILVTAEAAPTPFDRSASIRWIGAKGWDKPVDSQGDCRFDRDGDKLTITLPGGKARSLDIQKGQRDAPYLLREVAGNFMVEVRITGNFYPTACWASRSAGILLVAGKNGCTLERCGWNENERARESFNTTVRGPTKSSSATECSASSSQREGGYLRLVRRGDKLLILVSANGDRWLPMNEGSRDDFKLPHKVKIGVFAQTTGSGTFKAVFDQFKLTDAIR